MCRKCREQQRRHTTSDIHKLQSRIIVGGSYSEWTDLNDDLAGVARALNILGMTHRIEQRYVTLGPINA